MPSQQRSPDALTVLSQGEIELRGHMPWSSNATFLVSVCLDGTTFDAVYKPLRGERPLWDFPDGLYAREVAAYRTSEALGWGLVPETIVRVDAPLGVGSLQRFVDADFDRHYFTLMEDEEHHARLRLIGAFDLVINSADRKSGHCLIDSGGRIWAIDNGLSFHCEPKLRTVIWDFAGERLPGAAVSAIAALAEKGGELEALLADLLHPREVDALVRRCRGIVRNPVFPEPMHRRAYPWPLV